MSEPEPNDDAAVRVEAASEAALVALVAAIPGWGGPLAVVTQYVVGQLRKERVSELADSAFGIVPPEDFVAALRSDERLADMFVRAIEAASRTSHQAKRRAMGRVLANASRDTARIDEANLMVTALSELEAPHFRLLAELDATEGDSREALEISRRYPAPVPAALQRVGAAMNVTYDGGLAAEDDDPPSPVVSSLTRFGHELLRYVREAGK